MSANKRIVVVQHVPFEDCGSIRFWADARGLDLDVVHLDQGDSLPRPDTFALAVLMGGPMGVKDEALHSWLPAEKEWIQSVLQSDKPMIGICLGAQLIAQVLGAEVTRNPEPEIGWYPVTRCEGEDVWPEGWAELLPRRMTCLHWHGDTFGLPPGAHALYRSEVCENQAFLCGDNVLGLQFHLETLPNNLENLIEFAGDEMIRAPWIQSADELRAGLSHLRNLHPLMFQIMDRLMA